ncbi:MAG: AI-2E family transporter [Planctomycetota bacterium]|jgi:predicted PurR-regulated permease PerM|nr:AI-2E family transporter [Planctomycetota bacterium]
MNRIAAIRFGVVVVGCWLLWVLRPVTAPLLGAYLLMLVLAPLHRRWRIRLGSSVAAVACVGLLLLLPPLLALPAIFDFQNLLSHVPIDDVSGGLTQQLYEKLLEIHEGLPAWVKEDLTTEEIDPKKAILSAQSHLAAVGGAMMNFFGGMFGIISGLMLLPIFLYFLLEGGPWLARIRAELPSSWQPSFDRILPKIEDIMSLYLVSRTKVATYKGVITFILLLVLDFPGSYALGLSLGTLSLLPVLGPLLGFFLLALVGFADGGLTGGGFAGLLTATVIYASLEVLEGYVLIPRMVGRGLGLSDFAVIVTVLAGGALMGIFGLVIAVPMVAIGRVLYAEFVRPWMKAEHGPPEATATPAITAETSDREKA